MSERRIRFLKGVDVGHYKDTADRETVVMPIPDKVMISMSQHMGKPCDPTVAVGDQVRVGQVVGSTDAFIGAPVHASVSGKVVALEDIIMSNGQRTKTVVIESDKQQEMDASITPPEIKSKEDFVEAVKRSGLVGLGGAGFPTYVKFLPKTPVDTLIINGAECEPFITSDYRTMMEDTDFMVAGIRAVKEYMQIKQVYVGIEVNKGQAIEKVKSIFSSDQGIKVSKLPTQYPQGAEKVIIYNLTGRVVREGQLPSDVGVIVLNVTTAAFIGRYLKTGIPLVNKRITVEGTAVANPQNVLVPIGTPFADIIAFCGGYKTEPKKFLMGGPMMGITVFNDTYPLLKNNNAILALAEDFVVEEQETACIRCGRCTANCPFGLMPANFERSYQMGDIASLEALKINLCMECGCCSFVCPAKRHLVMRNRLAKKLVRESKK